MPTPVLRMMTIVGSSSDLLIELPVDDDTLGMSSLDEPQPQFAARCLAVLDCYAVREASAKTAGADFSGWLDRVCDVPGIEFADLTAVHGYLIAQGLVRFEFTGRSVGLQYQLSPAGRDAVVRRHVSTAEELRSLEPAA